MTEEKNNKDYEKKRKENQGLYLEFLRPFAQVKLFFQ
jgi:hypothetical protein